MITLADIDDKFPDTHDGSIYADLFKDVYGSRPRNVVFESIEEFQEDYTYLCEQVSKQIDEEKRQKDACFAKFVERVEATQNLLSDCSRERAIEILADSEGNLDNLKWYGYEHTEWSWNIPFGSIKKWLEIMENANV